MASESKSLTAEEKILVDLETVKTQLQSLEISLLGKLSNCMAARGRLVHLVHDMLSWIPGAKGAEFERRLGDILR